MYPGRQFQNHIPVRGRKPENGFVVATRLEKISKPYPRKGTETRKNNIHVIGLAYISKPYPRKGTETVLKLPFHFLIHYFKTISP